MPDIYSHVFVVIFAFIILSHVIYQLCILLLSMELLLTESLHHPIHMHITITTIIFVIISIVIIYVIAIVIIVCL